MKRLNERLDTLETTQAKGATLSGFAGLAELLAGVTPAALAAGRKHPATTKQLRRMATAGAQEGGNL